jgi:hypothetical protein
MDLIQLSNDLKNLSDQQLSQTQRDPAIPPYLVVTEMKRREDMRKAYQAQQQQPQQPTVAQQVMGQFQQQMQRPPMPPQGQPMPGQPQGIGQGLPGMMRQPMGAFGRPDGMPMQGPPPPQGGPPPAMRGGGIVAFAGGGGTDEAPNLSTGDVPQGGLLALLGSADADSPPAYQWVQTPEPDLPQTAEEWKRRFRPKERTIEDVNKMLSGLDRNDYLSPLAQKLAMIQNQMMRQKPMSPLIALGLGMAASRNPTFAGALGEGGIGALNNYNADKQQQQALMMQVLGAQAETARAQQQREEQRVHNVLGTWEKEGSQETLQAQELGANQREMERLKATAALKNQEMEQRYQENLRKLNLPVDPSSTDKAAMIANDPNETPQRKQWAKAVIATQLQIAAAKKGPDPNAQLPLLDKPVIPPGHVIFNGMVFASQSAADAYKKEKGL